MKNQPSLNGSSTPLASMIQLDSLVGFFQERQEGISLAPMMPSSNDGYVWRRVFLRKRQDRG